MYRVPFAYRHMTDAARSRRGATESRQVYVYRMTSPQELLLRIIPEYQEGCPMPTTMSLRQTASSTLFWGGLVTATTRTHCVG